MNSTNKLYDYYELNKLQVKDDDAYYSKLELLATGAFSSDAEKIPGIQMRIYLALKNSLRAGEFAGYPVETAIRISSFSEDYAAQVFEGNISDRHYNNDGLQRMANRLDTTTSRELKLFAGYDGRRWDFIASMGAKKAVLYIKNSVNPMIVQRYLMPFVPEQIIRRFISDKIEKKHKAGIR